MTETETASSTDIFAAFEQQFDEFVSNLEAQLAELEEMWEEVWTSMQNFFEGTWNEILVYLEEEINKVVETLNELIRSINKIPGMSIPLLKEVDLGGESEAERRAFSVGADATGAGASGDVSMFSSGSSAVQASVSHNSTSGINVSVSGNTVSEQPSLSEIAQVVTDKLTRSVQLYNLGSK